MSDLDKKLQTIRVEEDDISQVYAQIHALLFNGKHDLNFVEAIVLTTIDDMATKGMITPEQAAELEKLIKEVIAEPQTPPIIDGTYEVVG